MNRDEKPPSCKSNLSDGKYCLIDIYFAWRQLCPAGMLANQNKTQYISKMNRSGHVLHYGFYLIRAAASIRQMADNYMRTDIKYEAFQNSR
jgi:hypothetical protein